jgi:hypothetical protein
MKTTMPKPLRCAIYTRKSTEHNLDLAFNSLDAQREACEAYVKSQAHEGWRLLPRFLAPLAFVSPRIIDAIASGAAPADLTVSALARGLPHSWAEQQKELGVA